MKTLIRSSICTSLFLVLNLLPIRSHAYCTIYATYDDTLNSLETYCRSLGGTPINPFLSVDTYNQGYGDLSVFETCANLPEPLLTFNGYSTSFVSGIQYGDWGYPDTPTSCQYRPVNYPSSTPTPTPVPQDPSNNALPTQTTTQQNQAPNQCQGSIIHVDNRSVGESVAVVGAPFSLVYFSDRVSGRTDYKTIHIPLAGSNVSGISQIKLDVSILGRSFSQTFSPQPNLSYDFVWDGRDSFDRVIGTPTLANVTVTYVNSDGRTPSSSSSVRIGNYLASIAGLGGWTVSNAHYYDVNTKRIYTGDGLSRSVQPLSYNGGLLVTSEDGAEAYLFSNAGRHLETRDTLTGASKIKFGYNTVGRLITETDAFGNVTTIARTGNSPSSITSPYGQVTTITVDSVGYISSITNPAGEKYQVVTSPLGLLQTFTKPNGHSSYMTYDSQGKLISDSADGGSSSTFSESTANNVNYIQKLSAMNRRILFSSANSGDSLIRETTASSGAVSRSVESTYSAQYSSASVLDTKVTKTDDQRFGSMSSFTTKIQSSVSGTSYAVTSESSEVATIQSGDPLSLTQLVRSTTLDSDQGSRFENKYDGPTRTSQSTSAEGQTSTTTYDQNGHVLSIQPGQLAALNFAYDSNGRLQSISQGPRSTQMSYDTFGNVSSMQNALGLSTSMKYDPAGRITQQTRPDGKSIEYSYDSSGNLTSITPANNFAHQFAVNLSDDPASYSPPKVGGISTGSTLYSYNLDKQLTQVINPDGSIITYSYDPTTAQLVSVSGSSRSISLTYDETSKRLSGLQASDGIQTAYEFVGPLKTKESTTSSLGTQSLNLDYSNNMQLSGISLNSRSGLEQTVAISYDKDRRPIQIGEEHFVIDTQSGLLKSTSVGSVSQSLNYNSYGEQVSDLYKSGTKQIYSAEMARNALGQIISRKEKINGKTIRYDFTYDNLSRLTSEKIDGLPILTYSYDANGNRLSTKSLLGFMKSKETYDEQDRLLTFGDAKYSYDKMGNRIKKSIALGKGKSRDTLYSYNSFGQLSSVNLPDGKKIEYVIDGMGRRIGKKVNGKLVQGFVYQSQTQIAAETDGRGKVIKRFVYGEKANVPDYVITHEGIFRIITDQVGTLRMIVDTSTGRIVDESTSTAFGEIRFDCRRFLLPFGFAGGLYDRDTGLTHFGAREYDPEIGRFLRKDPTLFGGGDTNLYGYVMNDPINLIDPSGMTLEVVGDAADINAAIARLSKNPVAKALIDSFRNSSKVYTIFGRGDKGLGTSSSKLGGTFMNVGTQCGGQIDSTNGRVPTSLDRVLIHEMGHWTGAADDGAGNMNNINAFENAIMTPIDGITRATYNFY